MLIEAEIEPKVSDYESAYVTVRLLLTHHILVVKIVLICQPIKAGPK